MNQDLEKAIVSYLDSHRRMALATVKDDGSPYSSTVSYANKGLTIYFMTDPSSQGVLTWLDGGLGNHLRWDKLLRSWPCAKCTDSGDTRHDSFSQKRGASIPCWQ